MIEHGGDDIFDEVDAFLQNPPADRATLLRQAWMQSTGQPAHDELRRRSLAAQARSEPALAQTLLELEWGGRSHLDLHVHGAREDRHETSARLLGQFLARTSEAVKEVTKSIYGLARLVGDLGVVAPAPGSVRVTFIEQDDPVDQEIGTKSDLWAVGLHRVAMTLSSAQDGAVSLDAAMQDLKAPARRALRMLAETIRAGSWNIEGTYTERSGAERRIYVSTEAAERLIDAAERVVTETHPETHDGIVDAWRWSSHTVRFIPSRGPALEAFVPPEWSQFIASHNAAPGQRITAEFEVTTTARGKSARKTYRLIRASVIPDLFDLS